jgi:hypothetical protein
MTTEGAVVVDNPRLDRLVRGLQVIQPLYIESESSRRIVGRIIETNFTIGDKLEPGSIVGR